MVARWAPEQTANAKARTTEIYEVMRGGRAYHRTIKRIVKRNPENNRDVVQHDGRPKDLRTAMEMRLLFRQAKAKGECMWGNNPDGAHWSTDESSEEDVVFLPFVVED